MATITAEVTAAATVAETSLEEHLHQGGLAVQALPIGRLVHEGSGGEGQVVISGIVATDIFPPAFDLTERQILSGASLTGNLDLSLLPSGLLTVPAYVAAGTLGFAFPGTVEVVPVLTGTLGTVYGFDPTSSTLTPVASLTGIGSAVGGLLTGYLEVKVAIGGSGGVIEDDIVVTVFPDQGYLYSAAVLEADMPLHRFAALASVFPTGRRVLPWQIYDPEVSTLTDLWQGGVAQRTLNEPFLVSADFDASTETEMAGWGARPGYIGMLVEVSVGDYTEQRYKFRKPLDYESIVKVGTWL